MRNTLDSSACAALDFVQIPRGGIGRKLNAATMPQNGNGMKIGANDMRNAENRIDKAIGQYQSICGDNPPRFVALCRLSYGYLEVNVYNRENAIRALCGIALRVDVQSADRCVTVYADCLPRFADVPREYDSSAAVMRAINWSESDAA